MIFMDKRESEKKINNIIDVTKIIKTDDKVTK